jgi:hypothetical protein
MTPIQDSAAEKAEEQLSIDWEAWLFLSELAVDCCHWREVGRLIGQVGPAAPLRIRQEAERLRAGLGGLRGQWALQRSLRSFPSMLLLLGALLPLCLPMEGAPREWTMEEHREVLTRYIQSLPVVEERATVTVKERHGTAKPAAERAETPEIPVEETDSPQGLETGDPLHTRSPARDSMDIDGPGEPAQASGPVASEKGEGAGGTGESAGKPLGEAVHTALAGRAPMRFRSIGEAEKATLWVAETEVSEDQWMAVMGLDLSVVSGHGSQAADGMSWCQALQYANSLSIAEEREPAYHFSGDCAAGGSVAWDQDSEGYRLLTESEWTVLAQDADSSATAAGSNNQGLASVYNASQTQEQGLAGMSNNAWEWVWSGGRPAAMGCASGGGCRLAAEPSSRIIGVGMRLGRSLPEESRKTMRWALRSRGG